MKKQPGFNPSPGLAIRLSEKAGADGTGKIQIFKAGTFYHYYYGEFVLTTAIFAAMIENFEKKVYGIDSMIDYDHEMREAAAWIKRLYLSEDNEELWAEVDWTPPGKECIDQKTFRYISADFNMNFVNNETLVEYGPVLFGAALTNRPFIKGMAPHTELSENFNGGILMNLDQAKAEIVLLTDKNKTLSSEKDARDAEVKRLKDEATTKDTQIATLTADNAKLKESEVAAKKESEFAALLSEGKAVPAQKEAFLKGDMAAFAKAAGALNLGAKGSSESTEKPVGGKTEEEIMKLAEEKFAKGGYPHLGAAISAVKKELK